MSIATNTQLVTDLLTKHSTGHITLREKGRSNNLVTLVSTAGSDTDTTLVAVESQYRQDEIDGTLVLEGDRRFFCDSAKAVEKDNGDEVVIGGETWRIQSVRPISPAGTVLGYWVQCRK